MIHHDILHYRSGTYLWVAIVLVGVSIVLYLTQASADPPNGGTWQGYVLGSVGALLIVWLALLGIRKRGYRSSLGSVRGWTSAHVYLGSAVLIVATLHTAGQFAWNVHTLAYVLMCIVIFSGFYGVYAYLAHPRSVRGSRRGRSREQLFGDLYELNDAARKLSRSCGPDVQLAVESSIERTAIGGGAWAQLLGADRSTYVREAATGEQAGKSGPARNADQQAVVDIVADRIPRAEKGFQAENLQTLLSVLCRRQAVLRRIRTDIQLQAWLQVWLLIHVPFTIALLGALAVHIVVTFFYW
jgi:hypothetical protein